MFVGAIAGQLFNLLMAHAAHVDELSDFVWTVFIPAVRVASTGLLGYWLWQEWRVRCPALLISPRHACMSRDAASRLRVCSVGRAHLQELAEKEAREAAREAKEDAAAAEAAVEDTAEVRPTPRRAVQRLRVLHVTLLSPL